jgi:hypothetical protein
MAFEAQASANKTRTAANVNLFSINRLIEKLLIVVPEPVVDS